MHVSHAAKAHADINTGPWLADVSAASTKRGVHVFASFRGGANFRRFGLIFYRSWLGVDPNWDFSKRSAGCDGEKVKERPDLSSKKRV